MPLYRLTLIVALAAVLSVTVLGCGAKKATVPPGVNDQAVGTKPTMSSPQASPEAHTAMIAKKRAAMEQMHKK